MKPYNSSQSFQEALSKIRLSFRSSTPVHGGDLNRIFVRTMKSDQ